MKALSMPHKYDPLKVMAAISLLNALGGFAALLRSGEKITGRSVATSCLNSALIGLAVAAIWWHRYDGDNASIFFLVGVCLMTGLGGNTTFYFAAALIKKKFGLEDLPHDGTAPGTTPEPPATDNP